MKISFDKDEILSAIDRVAKKTMTMDLTWDWPCGVAYYGLAEAYKATGKTEYMEFLKNWVDEYIEMGLPSWNVNTCAMGHCLITLYEYTGDKKYWDIIMSIWHYYPRKSRKAPSKKESLRLKRYAALHRRDFVPRKAS